MLIDLPVLVVGVGGDEGVTGVEETLGHGGRRMVWWCVVGARRWARRGAVLVWRVGGGACRERKRRVLDRISAAPSNPAQ